MVNHYKKSDGSVNVHLNWKDLKQPNSYQVVKFSCRLSRVVSDGVFLLFGLLWTLDNTYENMHMLLLVWFQIIDFR